MERVKPFEVYWYIDDMAFLAVDNYDRYAPIDTYRYETGNYFHTKEEAESMARKLRAVLKGADVIEMPSEEEIQKVLAEKIPIHGGRTYSESLNCCWFEEGINWLRDNKIVK